MPFMRGWAAWMGFYDWLCCPPDADLADAGQSPEQDLQQRSLLTHLDPVAANVGLRANFNGKTWPIREQAVGAEDRSHPKVHS